MVKKQKKENFIFKKFSIFWKTQDRLMALTIIALLALNVAMVISASSGIAGSNDGLIFKTIMKLGLFDVAALIVYFICGAFYNKKIMVKNKHYFIFGFIMLGLLFVPLMFPEVNGARAWIDIKIGTIQPSEFMKVFLILFFSTLYYLLELARANNTRLDEPFPQKQLKFLLYAGLSVFIVFFLQNDLGSAIVMICIVFVVGFFDMDRSELSKFYKTLRSIFLIGFVSVLALWVFTPILENLIQLLPLQDYQIDRFLSAADPTYDPLGSSFQLINSLYAFATGGLEGLGFGESIQKFGYIPEAQTDYILAITAEELGIIGVSIVFAGYAIICGRLSAFTRRAKCLSDKVILLGVQTYMFMHLLLNAGGVIGLIPLTGVPLLFVSNGGSSLLAIVGALAICQNIIVKIKLEEKKLKKLKEK